MPNRGGSGPWGRLKPVDLDPLESMGLPSKGDSRLLDFKAQNGYYTKIVERYMTFCSDAGERDELLRRFASMGLSDSTASGPAKDKESHTPGSKPAPGATQAAAPPTPSSPVLAAAASNAKNSKTLSDILMALRKLREGIVASQRADDFAVQAYLFCIRLAVLVRAPESYQPAILHLLRAIHPRHPLTSLERAEAAGYLVLDAACRRRDLAEAYALRRRWGLRDARVDRVLHALAHDDYALWRRTKRSVDGHRRELMEFAERDMRTHVLKCFGRAYLSVDVEFLERETGAEWADLTAKDGVGWELEGRKVVIRKIKGR